MVADPSSNAPAPDGPSSGGTPPDAEPASETPPAAPVPHETPRFSDKGGWLVLAGLVLFLDLWSKEAVFEALPEHGRELWIGSWFGCTKVRNTGMMWGALQGFGDVLRWLRLVAAGVVLAMMRSTPAGSRLLQTALALVLGGAVGNIYDGFRYGFVRDFIMVDLDIAYFDPFPIFNVADSAICVGVGLLAIGLLTEDAGVGSSGKGDAADPDAPAD